MIEYYDRFVVDLCPDSGSRYVVSDNAGDGVAIAFVNDFEEALDAIHDLLEREKLARINDRLDALGVGGALDFALSGAIWSNKSPEALAINEKLTANRQTLNKIGIKLQYGFQATSDTIFGALLRWFGLWTVREQRRVDGQMVSFYRLCPNDLSLTRQDLAVRFASTLRN